MLRLLLCILLVSSHVSPAVAQWKATFKNLFLGADNTLLLVQYTPIQKLEGQQGRRLSRDFLLQVNAFPKGTYQTAFRKEIRLQVTGAETFQLPFRLTPGEYDMSLDIHDPRQDEHFFFEQDYTCFARSGALTLSDIFLSYQPFPESRQFEHIQPTLEPVITLDSNRLYFWIEVYGTGDGNYPAGALIFHESGGSPGSHTSSFQASTEKSGTLRLVNGRATYSDWFDRSSLEEGEYQLNVFVGPEGGRREKKLTFVVEGALQRRIYADLDESIRMMKLNVFTPGAIEALLQEEDPELQVERFLRTWHQAYEQGRWRGELGEKARKQMESFYELVFAAEDLLRASGEGWDSDRGRIFVSYGKPARIEELTLSGDTYERWTYKKWDLSFLFEKRNQGYFLIE